MILSGKILYFGKKFWGNLMKSEKPKFGLATKFTLLVTIPIIIVSLTLSQNYIRSSTKLIKAAMIERGKSIAKGLSVAIEYGLTIENKDMLRESLASYREDKDILYINILNTKGISLASYGQRRDTDAANIQKSTTDTVSENDLFGDNKDKEYILTETSAEYDFVFDVMAVRKAKAIEDIDFLNINPDTKSKRKEKIGTIQMGLSKVDMINSVHRARSNAILLTIAFIAAGIASTILLVRLMVNPIRRLALASEIVSRGDFDHPVKVKSKDEIGNLAGSFNKMVGDLKKSNETIQYRLEIEKLVNSISTSFIALEPAEVDNGINSALKDLGEFVGVDRSYVFIMDNSKNVYKISNIYKWCNKESEAYIENLEEFKVENHPNVIEKLRQFENVCIPRISDLPLEMGKALRSYGIKSIVMVPLIYGESFVGFLGLDSIHKDKDWTQEDIAILKMVGDIFVNALERKKAHQALQHQLEVEEQMTRELENKTRELSRSNEELNSFAYTVSHDLKAPVVSLQGFSSLLLEGYKDSFDDTGRLYVERIMKNSERMGTLIDDLLELSRIGRIKGQEQLVDISELVSDIASDFSPQLDSKGAKLTITGEMPKVRCDRTRISQVFANLIGNANKFMGDDNDNPTIEVGYESQNGNHLFFVKDNGIGIDKEHHAKIFQIFQRLNDVEVEGTGVGLAIVKKIVENFGGKIWVDSEKGKGTTMYFTVPK